MEKNMLFKNTLTVALLLSMAPFIYAMENPSAKYESTQLYLKEHFNKQKEIASLQDAQIIAFGEESHASHEIYEKITHVVNTLADAQTTFLIEGLERGKVLDFKTKQWGNVNSSVVVKGCDLSSEKLDAIRASIGAKVAEYIALIRSGQKLGDVTLLNDDEVIIQRNKEFITAMNDEIAEGKKVIISFGSAHYDQLPEAQELQDYLASKKSCVYFAKVNQKPESQRVEESNNALKWLQPYVQQP